MKLGLLTAPFPRRSLAQVASWAAGEGFQIRNLVYQSRPGLVVTANLYVPDPPPADSSRAAPGLFRRKRRERTSHALRRTISLSWLRSNCRLCSIPIRVVMRSSSKQTSPCADCCPTFSR